MLNLSQSGMGQITPTQGRNKLRNRIDDCDVIRFVSMTSLGSTAAPDCPTGHSKGRYCARVASILFLSLFLPWVHTR